MHNLNVLTLTVPNKLAKLINLPQSDGAKCNLRSNSSTVSVLHCKILLKETQLCKTVKCNVASSLTKRDMRKEQRRQTQQAVHSPGP